MKCKVNFQYKAVGAARPEDCVQDEEIIFEKGENVPIPAVGDSVIYTYGGKQTAGKVVSRHFTYLSGYCCVNLVVTDIPSDEMLARLKE